jgi:SM-20-related protein
MPLDQQTIPLFEINPKLDRRALALEFARNRRIQVRNVLTDETAKTIFRILSQETRWGLGWQAASDGPHSVRADKLAALGPAERTDIQRRITAAIRGRDYAFAYMQYHLVEAYLGKWAEGGVHDLLLEHINDTPFLDLVRTITGMSDLIKADGQATLYAPNQFLALHDDSHVAQGWKVAYVLNLAPPDWRPEWGGYLLFHDEEGDVVQGFKPRFNALNLFAVPQKHSVSYVPPFAPVGRFAITGWFRNV